MRFCLLWKMMPMEKFCRNLKLPYFPLWTAIMTSPMKILAKKMKFQLTTFQVVNLWQKRNLSRYISSYRTNIRGKKWYFTIICYCLDIMAQNAWQLHGLPNGELEQLAFRRRIVLALLESNSESRKRGRPSSLENVDSRFDRIDHLVSSQEKQTRCRVCHKKVKTKCVKCDVALHIECFIRYHKQQS